MFFMCSAIAQVPTTFTYQGRLTENGSLANGNYDFRFAIYDGLTAGTALTHPLTNASVIVSNGLFTVLLDFGAGVFSDGDRWLEMGVRANGSAGAFTILAPRQPITSSPYAIHAGSVNSVPAGSITGTITDAQLPADIARLTVQNTRTQATGTPTVANGFVISARVTNGGSGYTAAPAVTISDATGSGATITATVSNGMVASLTVANAGSGYSSGATLTIEPPPSNAYQVFASSNFFTGVNTLTNPANIIAGNGAGLTSLNASQLTTGTVPDAQLGSNVARTTQVWLLSGNGRTELGNHFLGTTDDQPLELRVNNMRALRIEAKTNDAPNIVGGATINFVAPGVIGGTIGGGGARSYYNTPYSNSVAAHFGTIGGGIGNAIAPGATFGGTIAGGEVNTIGSNSSYSAIGGGGGNKIAQRASYSTIAGGSANNIGTNSEFSAIGGGSDHTIDIDSGYSVIGGGRDNGIGTNAGTSTIGGGVRNTIGPRSIRATIAGGSGNDIGMTCDSSTVGGGSGNSVGNGTLAGTVAGGQNNRIEASSYSSIGGGYGHTISSNSFAATIPGGYQNSVAGDYGFSAGRSAQANHDGAFVWADSVNAAFASERINQFRVRAAGGARFDINNTHWVNLYMSIQGFIGKVIDTSTGAYLSTGGSWVNNSDRAAKENVQPVNGEKILEALAELPISSWSYRNEDTAVRHIGPMAQDFHAAFGAGADEKHIATIDADGVALVAIQGLNQKVKEQRAEIAELKQRLERLEKRMTKSE